MWSLTKFSPSRTAQSFLSGTSYLSAVGFWSRPGVYRVTRISMLSAIFTTSRTPARRAAIA